jgi:hypothetical protein
MLGSGGANGLQEFSERAEAGLSNALGRGARQEVSAELEYVHQLKTNKTTDLDELNRQVNRQVDAMNTIIEKEGMQGLKQRINNYSKELEQEGRAYVITLGPAGEGRAWLHEPDMSVGGAPRDVTVTGERRVNSILGGQARSLRNAILNMPDEVTKITPRLTIRPAR